MEIINNPWFWVGMIFIAMSIAIYIYGFRLNLFRGKRAFWYFASVATVAALIFHFWWIPLLIVAGGTIASYLLGYPAEAYLILFGILILIIVVLGSIMYKGVHRK